VVRLLLALALAAVPASDGISAFAGGRQKSPDGKWAVWAAPADPDSERAAAVARLNGPGVRDRELLRFGRQIDVVWPQEDPGVVLVVQRTTRFAAVYAFTLGPTEAKEDRIQSDLDRGLARRTPRLGSIENRRIAFGWLGVATCMLVEESGLPPEREAGSPVARRGAFRLDLQARRALPVADCPGARID
jgi:hypothetical protein